MFANNIGASRAVCWGMMFKFGYIGKFDKGYEAMGYIIIASSVFSIFMRIKGQKTMFGTPSNIGADRRPPPELARRRKTTCTYSYSLPRVHDTRIAHSTLSRIIPAAPSRRSRAAPLK